jgi:glycosyltransferase involved in cell wall biosynthesis
MSDNPEIIYSIATRIGGHGLGLVSYNAVRALYDGGYLKLAVCYGNRSDIPRSKLWVLKGNPAKLLFFLPRHYYRPMRKGFLDFVTSRIISRRGCDIFHGWNNQARRSIRVAKKVGAITVMDCGSTHLAYRDEILNDEYRRYGMTRVDTAHYAKSASIEEYSISDHIILASEFAKKTFVRSGIDEKKLFVLQRAVNFERFRTVERVREGTFRVLFAGNVSLRKGVQYLLEAWSELKLNNAELILAGNIDDSMKTILAGYSYMNNIRYRGFVKDIAQAYRECSVFVFPSLEEGSAKVTYEAMASGLPTVTTENSGSLVRDGLDGFVVPIRDKEALKEKLTYLYENPDDADRLGKNARETVKNYSWQNYQDTLLRIYNVIMEKNGLR